MTIYKSRQILALLSLGLGLTLFSGGATAHHIYHGETPRLGIDYYGSHNIHNKKRKNYHRRYHKRNYHNDYYRSRPRHYSYEYSPRRGYGYNGYGYQGYYGNNYCPTPGFSLRFYRNRGCYSHGNHYHCD